MSEFKVEHMVTSVGMSSDKPFVYLCKCGRSDSLERMQEHLDAEQLRGMTRALMDGRPIWILGRMFDPNAS